MLAGLGQIHIDGDVTMYALPDHSKVGDFHLKKTFAWGGIYGSSTSMEDIETTFADGRQTLPLSSRARWRSS